MNDLENVSFKEAVRKMSMLLDFKARFDGLKGLDAFSASIVLAVLFGKSKEDCLDALVKFRMEGV